MSYPYRPTLKQNEKDPWGTHLMSIDVPVFRPGAIFGTKSMPSKMQPITVLVL